MQLKNKSKSGERDPGGMLSEKRTKVHAQRKFALGSPTFVSHKDKDHEKNAANNQTASSEIISEIIPNICLKTEDFLTFLCFRGTPLAESIDFFKNSTPATQNGHAANISTTSKAANPTVKSEKKTETNSKNVNNKTSTTKSVKPARAELTKMKKPVSNNLRLPRLHSSFHKRTGTGTGMVTRLNRLNCVTISEKISKKRENVLQKGKPQVHKNISNRIATRSQKKYQRNVGKRSESTSESETESESESESESEAESDSESDSLASPAKKKKINAMDIDLSSPIRTRRSSQANNIKPIKSPGTSCSKNASAKSSSHSVANRSNVKATRQSKPTGTPSKKSNSNKKEATKTTNSKSNKNDSKKFKGSNSKEANKKPLIDNKPVKTSKPNKTIGPLKVPFSPKTRDVVQKCSKVNSPSPKGKGAKCDSSASASTTNVRPTRRTKEAATLYLTIIGHEEELDSSETEEDEVVEEKKESSAKAKAKTETGASSSKSVAKKRMSGSPVGVRTRRGAPTHRSSSPASKKRAILREAAKRFTETKTDSSSEGNESTSEEEEDSEADSEQEETESKTSKVTSKVVTRSSRLRSATQPSTTSSEINNSRQTRAASKNDAKRSLENTRDDKNRVLLKRKMETDLKKATESQNASQKPVDKTQESINTRKRASKRSDAATPPLITNLDLLSDAPVFKPTEKEFGDPIEYLQKIAGECERFGICRIVPPASFKPECEVSDAMRFTAYNQYVHRMFRRKGSNSRQLDAIHRHLTSLDIDCTPTPCIGGIEVDLPGLYQAVEQLGGPMKVLEKNLWPKVADMMKIPKAAQDRLSKLDTIYCKYLLPYATLSDEERKKLMNKVDSDRRSDDDIECVVKGNSMALNTFYRIARNTMAVWFPSANSSTSDSSGINPEEVESTYWRLVTDRNAHACVHSGNIDSGQAGYGFPCNKTARHPWNLKVLTNNNGSVLRSIGPVMGATVPTLHVGMLFSANCWYRDPHGLPWIEYLHTGAEKIWYGVPSVQEPILRQAMTKLVPDLVQTDKSVWLSSDTVMVPPTMLAKEGVTLSRTVQRAGQFIVVWPRAFTASLCTGYTVSESVYFAPADWLPIGDACFKESQASCEPTVFSMHQLLWSIASDSRSSVDVLKRISPMLQRSIDEELQFRSSLRNFGVHHWGKISAAEQRNETKKRRRSSAAVNNDEDDMECDECRVSLFFSRAECKLQGDSTVVWCLHHALEKIKEKPRNTQNIRVLTAYDKEDLRQCLQRVQDVIRIKGHRRTGGHQRNATC